MVGTPQVEHAPSSGGKTSRPRLVRIDAESEETRGRGGEDMFGRKATRADRIRHDARKLAKRGKHRAETLREALPEPAELISELKDRAEPVIEAAKEQAEKAPMQKRKKSRSKKPLLFIALAVIGAVVAYLILSRRDHEPAYLREEPDEPPAWPADQPTVETPADDRAPEAPTGGTPSEARDASASQVNGAETPERVSAYMAGEPAQPTQAASASPQTPGAHTPSASSTWSSSPSSSPAPESSPSYGYQPRSQVAAWDLPPSSIPPMRGGNSSL